MSWMLLSELCAVCTIETASPTLRLAWSRPFTWAERPWLIEYPAASSAAVLIRRPDDRRCIAVATASLEASRLRCVSIAEMFVRIERDISYHLRGDGRLLVSRPTFLVGLIRRNRRRLSRA